MGSSLHTMSSSNDTVRCLHLESLKAHNQPITTLETNGAYIVTGSQDHMLKVGILFSCNTNIYKKNTYYYLSIYTFTYLINI